MKHQGKQALAWVIAVSAASTVYGGAAFWMKRLATQNSSDHGHGEEEHGDMAEHHVAAHGVGDHDQASSEHHAESDGHKGQHAEADGGHQAKLAEHQVEHGAPKAATEGHGDHEKATAHEEHGSTKGHEEKATGHAAPHGHETAALEHGEEKHAAAKERGKEEHAAAKEHGEDKHTAAKEHGKEEHQSAHVASAEHGKEVEKAKDAKPHDAHAAPHWSYEKKDAAGPHSWGQLADQFSQCEKGREQSPIDLRGAVTKASAPHIAWHYAQAAVNVQNNGHTIVSSMPNEQNHITIDGEKYTLAQFHFHNPSEHKIGGIPSDMELHFVHKNDKGQLAVIGVMINEKAGNENPFFKPLWATLPREAQAKSESKPSLNLAKMLPTHRDYFHYAGSLTTPPCSQGVRWFVLKEPVSMNGSQIELYAGIFGGVTNRPIQPAFGREIIQSSGPAAVAH